MKYVYEISKEIYNYLLPVYGKSAEYNGFKRTIDSPYIVERSDKNEDRYYFIGNPTEYIEMCDRCKYL